MIKKSYLEYILINKGKNIQNKNVFFILIKKRHNLLSEEKKKFENIKKCSYKKILCKQKSKKFKGTGRKLETPNVYVLKLANNAE